MKLTLVVLNLLFYYCMARIIVKPPDKKQRSVPPSQISKEINPNTNSEPTCEELKSMWRTSRAETRGSLSSNELPAIFGFKPLNDWHNRRQLHDNTVATTRSGGGGRAPAPAREQKASLGFRSQKTYKPVYGKIVYSPPPSHQARLRQNPGLMAPYHDFVRHYSKPRGRAMLARPLAYLRGGYPLHYHRTWFPSPQRATFNQLKVLVMAERARELYSQRLAEAAAARRMAFFKGLGRIPPGNHDLYGMNYPFTQAGTDLYPPMLQPPPKPVEQPKPGILVFPDLLAPAARMPEPGDEDQLVGRFVSQMVFNNDNYEDNGGDDSDDGDDGDDGVDDDDDDDSIDGDDDAAAAVAEADADVEAEMREFFNSEEDRDELPNYDVS